jgi:hypothetical protein
MSEYDVENCCIIIELSARRTFLVPVSSIKYWHKNLFKAQISQSNLNFDKFLRENDIKECDYPTKWHDEHTGEEYEVVDIKSLICAVFEMWMNNGYDIEDEYFSSVGQAKNLFLFSL